MQGITGNRSTWRAMLIIAVLIVGVLVFGYRDRTESPLAAPEFVDGQVAVPAPDTLDVLPVAFQAEPEDDEDAPAPSERTDRAQPGSLPPEVAAALADNPSGREALAAIGDSLPLVAEISEMSTEQAADILATDDSAHVDAMGHLFYLEPIAADDLSIPGDDQVQDDSYQLFPYDQTFLLNSRPGAQRTIYLDFTGHTTRNTVQQFRGYIEEGHVSPVWSRDASNAFSDREKNDIQQIWARVVEDFSSWDVNITTQEPPQSDITRNGIADHRYGQRVVISPDDDFREACNCGGIAGNFGAFDIHSNHAYYDPVFVLHGKSAAVHVLATTVTHEVGHNLGLLHDGAPGEAYYTNDNGDLWAPVMGAGYYNPITQFSRGEYSGANNFEDDFNDFMINGLRLLRDDHGDGWAGTVVTGGRFDHQGLIHRFQAHDVDAFVFAHAGGPVDITAASGWDDIPDLTLDGTLDIKLELIRGTDRAVVATSDPLATRRSTTYASGMDASIATDLEPGIYTLNVTSIERAPTATSGYAQYGSVGTYTLTGTYVEAGLPTRSVVYENDFEDTSRDSEWRRNRLSEDTAASGRFEIGNPAETRATDDGNGIRQLGNAYSGNRTIVSGASAGSSFGANDIDGGRTSFWLTDLELPEGANVLSFAYNYGTSRNNDYDLIEFRVRDRSGNRPLLWRFYGSGQYDGRWVTAEADLSRWSGQTIDLELRAQDVQGISLVEAQVDDVRIENFCLDLAACGGPTPSTTTTTPGSTTSTVPGSTTTTSTTSTSTSTTTTTTVPEPGGGTDGPVSLFFDDFEIDRGWSFGLSTDTATNGLWDRSNPEATYDTSTGNGGARQLGTTISGDYSLNTGGAAGTTVGSYDVDGGWTAVRSPQITVPTGGRTTVGYWYNFATSANADGDYLRLDVHHGGGRDMGLATVSSSAARTGGWEYLSRDVSAYAGQTIAFQFAVYDYDSGSLVEAQIDDFDVRFDCTLPAGCDVSGEAQPSLVWSDDFETDRGWAVQSGGTATAGAWSRGNPDGTTDEGTDRQLGTTVSGSYALNTDGRAGSNGGTYDVDGGTTSIRSPSISVPVDGETQATFRYNFATSKNADGDYLRLHIVAGGRTTQVFETSSEAIRQGLWEYRVVDLSDYAGQDIQLQFTAADTGSGSVVEAQIDDVRLTQRTLPTGSA